MSSILNALISPSYISPSYVSIFSGVGTLVSQKLPNQPITVSPSKKLEIKASGVGHLEITFSVHVPPSLAQYAVSSNSVEIPVFGHIELELVGVTSITPVNVTAKIKEYASSLAAINVSKFEPKIQPPKNVTLSISSGSVSSVIQDNEQIPTPQTLAFYVGDNNIEFTGYGVEFNVHDYDPIAKVPAGDALYIDLATGSPTNFEEAPANAGISVMKSYTGYIVLSNFRGTGIVNMFLTK